MSNSYRIRTEIGKDKFLQVKLDQDYDKLELLSLDIFPNDIYPRNCADFGVICGRVFSNGGLGIENARVSVFIPLQEEDELNPIISTLYPYKSFEQFNEDGYKYNLLPYTESHSGHVPVGTFPERIDALTNRAVIEVYDKYYKFTAKTNNAGDFMIFGVPVGQYDLFMQVDLSDIGEFSLTPQDLLRSGRATESQLDGTRFKFSENYSELPQIVTLTKTVQVAPFYGQKEVCDYFITRADFDLTLESFVEILPTAVFMGSILSTEDRRKLRNDCKVPAKQGWLCNLVSGPGSIETVRQTVNLADDGRPILENFLLERDGKLIDENGAWLIELPMNLDYVYTDEFGNRVLSPDGSKGVPTKGKYRFKIKWSQSTFVNDENKRAYFLVPNVKEWGWTASDDDPIQNNVTMTYTVNISSNDSNPVEAGFSNDKYSVIESLNNVDSYKILYSNTGNLVDAVEKKEWKSVVPPLSSFPNNSAVFIEYSLINPSSSESSIKYKQYDENQFQLLSSYAFSVDWAEYGSSAMINEAINCEDRFYQFEYNKVYTVSQLIDRYTSKGINLFFPQRVTQIKHITDNTCAGNYNTFPTNDAYYRYDIMFIIISTIISFLKFIFIPLTIVVHILALFWPVIAMMIILFQVIYAIIVAICNVINGAANIIGKSVSCPDYPEISLSIFTRNPFKNIKLPLILFTEDGCQSCKCNIQEVDVNDNELATSLNRVINQLSITNITATADLQSNYAFNIPNTGALGNVSQGPSNLNSVSVGLNSSNSAYATVNRCPFFPIGAQSSAARLYSTDLPIVERINLFNTKAKYFDRDANGEFGQYSPGNVGWNQMKVKFMSNVSSNSNKHHFDNLIVMVLDSVTALTQGDLITFQKPTESTDPNNYETDGYFYKPETITVKYANPTYKAGESTVEYDVDQSVVDQFGNILYNIRPEPLQRKTCYPADIEYFQVIRIQKLTDYKSQRNQLDRTGDTRFSLPWRFLDTSYDAYPGKCNRYNPPTDGASKFNNACAYYQQFRPEVADGNLIVANQNFPLFDQNKSYSTDDQYSHVSFDTWNYFTGKTEAAVCFLVRGVDPHSGPVRIKYDLSRLYGYTDYDQHPEFIEEGDFYMNIPIQHGTSNSGGLLLPSHLAIDTNNPASNHEGLSIFYKSYFFTYAQTTTPTIVGYNPSWETKNHLYYSALGFAYLSQFQSWDTAMPNINFGNGVTYNDNYITHINSSANFMSKTGCRRVPQMDNSNATSDLWTGLIQDEAVVAQACCGGYDNNGCIGHDSDCTEIGTQKAYGCLAAYSCRNNPQSDNGAFYGLSIPYPFYDGSANHDTRGYAFTMGDNDNYRKFKIVNHIFHENSDCNHVGGYWGDEYVEGGSCMYIKVVEQGGPNYTNDGGYTWRQGYNVWGPGGCSSIGNNVIDYNRQGDNSGGTPIEENGLYYPAAVCPRNYEIRPEGGAYISPVYDKMDLDTNYPDSNAYNNEHRIQMNNYEGIVFRSDRLPSSDRPNGVEGYQNGLLLQQNEGLRIFKYPKVSGGCVSVFVAGGNTAITPVSLEPDNSLYDSNVVQSTQECTKAVDLNSYYINSNNEPDIKPQDPFSKQGRYKWFERGEGCYNLVSRPVLSLLPRQAENKTYSDIATVVEWTQRIKLTLAACFDIFSHSFSNNWINGTLYSYPFQLTTFFGQDNTVSSRKYCKDLIYFNDTINNFFYRVSPYNGNNFIGHSRWDCNASDDAFGNCKNLKNPTTIMDLGPKNTFIQELVYSDIYDGYIADKIPSSSFQNIETILNMFLLSRMINTRFLQLLIPTNSDDGNNQGSDDPSIQAFFSNQRWKLNDLFASGALPGMIDGDYSQLISINSELGVLEFNSTNYTADDLKIYANNTSSSNNAYASFGVIFSGFNQWRDYISPRRKIWNGNSTNIASDSDFTMIPGVYSQEIPLYQWKIDKTGANNNKIFGWQNNNFVTNESSFFSIPYQTLDRMNTNSEYFKPETNLLKAYKGYIANYSVNGTSITPSDTWPNGTPNPITFGAPFHFYFGLIRGASAMDLFITKYVDTTISNEAILNDVGGLITPTGGGGGVINGGGLVG